MQEKSFSSKNIGLLPCLLFFIIIMRAKLAAKKNQEYTFLTPLIKNNFLEQKINNHKETITLRLESNSGIFGLTVLACENIFISAHTLKKESQIIKGKYLLDYYEPTILIKGTDFSESQNDIIEWLFFAPQLISQLRLQEDLHFQKSSPQEVYDALSSIIEEWKGCIQQGDNFPLDYVHIGHLEIYFEKYFSLLILEKVLVKN